jgi:hypothetical protein
VDVQHVARLMQGLRTGGFQSEAASTSKWMRMKISKSGLKPNQSLF